ncbi:helicase HerA domain-containing protein [Suttonella ornithocola]|uniref:Type IV secretory pathway, VirB4 components n=1 Tax=Suttonella ornithocola TaxID=279832 RepID=A0A380MR31_9GAMM|nr:DUF87 domain-containing protein [Suttonella ornithocola]SUO95035.1 Type IV secretory pathway, VirB4 components [Suttonella ornithocola]
MSDTIPEKIGQFYLGRESYPANGTPVLFNAADLTTHAIIIGMTGSGKTGLGISLLEEAALDNIPVIAIDPKGDLGNLALNFPDLASDNFLPYADTTALNQNQQTPENWATATAEKWKTGILESGQSLERMQLLKAGNPVRLYTPGSTTGYPLALIGDFAPPEPNIREQSEAYAAYLDGTASALLALLKQENNTLDPQHIFLTHLFKHSWDQGQTLTLADLIAQIQNPPFQKIGILPVAQVFPDKNRVALALALNNLLAAPSFTHWRTGNLLETETLLYDAQRRPQTSVLNIAHLSDNERMYFVTLLLTNLINWMRRQPGTSTLRAILYMDEIAGYLPPNANPASKAPFLQLLKQARAFGIGLVLSSQNPIDLDYKALSNAGTWFIGRLQTAQDRARVTEGLLSAGENGITKNELDQWFDQLGKRQFLLHDIHRPEPIIFHTRWAMSYLAGPLNRAQISALTATNKTHTPAAPTEPTTNNRPAILPTGIQTYYLPTTQNSEQAIHYFPTLLGIATLYYQDNKAGVRTEREILLSAAIDSDNVDWKTAEALAQNTDQLQTRPQQPAYYHEAPIAIQKPKNWQNWEKTLKTALRQSASIDIYYAPDLKQYSEPGETETAFRNRLATTAREQRDAQTMTLRQKYTTKQISLNKQLLTAEQALNRENKQASSSLLDAGIAIGGALLGAFTGRKVLSQTNIQRAASAAKKVGQISKERQDSAAAQAKYELIQSQIQQLEEQLKAELSELQQRYQPENLTLETKTIDAKASDIEIKTVALLYRSLS